MFCKFHFFLKFRQQKIDLVHFVADQMSLVAIFCGEYLLAVPAMILNPSMFLHVQCVMRSSIEAFPALVTVVAVLPGVYLHVLIQVPSGGVFLFTESTVESVSVFLRLFNRSIILGGNKLINLCAKIKIRLVYRFILKHH